MRFFQLAAIVTLPLALSGPVLAAGSDSPTISKPTTTQTTKTCKGIKVWDPAAKKCVNPQGSSLDQDQLGEAVRELAYAGRNADAQGVLRAMADQDSDLVLTYWGFTHRRLGDMDQAMVFYDRALTTNPDNLLARSYLGQAHVEAGRMSDAKTQLAEIRSRGGKGTWPEVSLARAIASGATYDY